MAINKVVYGNNTLVDLTEDTVTENKVLEGETFHDASGQKRTGSLVIPVQDVEVNGESVVDENGIAEVVVPVSGDVSTTDSFESYTGGKVKSAQMELKPIQDLHGYDHPWVGGAGKNKFDDTLIVNPSATAQWIQITLKPNTNYTVSSNIPYYSTSAYIFAVSGTNTSSATSATDGVGLNTPRTVTADSNGIISFAYRNNGGGGVLDLTQYHYQIEEGSTATAYESYENICPISGHTQAKLEQRGKNFLPLPIAETKNGVTLTHNADGSVTLREGTATATTYFDFFAGDFDSTTYAGYLFRADSEYTSWGAATVLFRISGSDRAQLQSLGGNSDIAINDNGNGLYFAIRVANGFVIPSGGITIYPMLRKSTDTADFEPYQGKDYIINLGGTYYWLTGDVVSGKWYVVGKGVDLGTLDWAKMSGVVGRFYAHPTINIKPVTSTAVVGNIICSQYKAMSQNDLSNGGISIDNSVNPYINIIDVDKDSMTASDFKTAMSGVQLVYELATPIPLDLDPQQILAIIGENHFSAPLEQQEIIEIIARNIAEFNEVIDDENISDKFTYSSEKIEDRLDEYVDKDSVEEKSATTEFSTINGGLLSSLKVALSPIQDLHGYDSPWVGGARKNKMPITATSQTISGVVITVNDDGSFHVSGTATADVYLTLGETSVDANTWIASCGVIGNWSSYGIYIRNETDGVTINMIDSLNYTFTLSATKTIRFVLLIKSGQTLNTDFYPMLRLSTESDPTFEPYSNICPISGHTEVDIWNHQKNLWDEMWEVGTFSTLTGEKAVNNNAIRTLNDIYVSPNTSYYCGCDTSDCYIWVFFYDNQNALIQGYTTGKEKYQNACRIDNSVFTTPSNCSKIKYYISGEGNTYNHDVIIALSSTATPYEPYKGASYVTPLGTTIYMANIDMVSGGCDVIGAGETYDGSNDESWQVNGTGTDKYFFYLNKPSNTMVGYSIIANEFETEEIFTSNTNIGIYNTSSQIRVRPQAVEQSIADWRTWLSNNPLQVVYELATPQHIQLSPQLIQTLVGENNLSAPLEGQEITEAKYKEMFDFGDVLEVIGEDYFTLPLQTFTFTNKICNVNDSRVTSNSLVDVYFTSASMSSVEDAGITVESQNGKIVMTAEEQPVGTIQGRIKVVN